MDSCLSLNLADAMEMNDRGTGVLPGERTVRDPWWTCAEWSFKSGSIFAGWLGRVSSGGRSHAERGSRSST